MRVASAGLPEYTGLVVEAIGGREDVVLVAASLGGFTAPLVAQRVPVRALVLVNAMIPVPGETLGVWWGNTGSAQAREAGAERGGYSTDFDLNLYFLHDVPPEVIASGEDEQFSEADAVFGPATNGGFWLLGLRRPDRSLLAGVPMSAPAAYPGGHPAWRSPHRTGAARSARRLPHARLNSEWERPARGARCRHLPPVDLRQPDDPGSAGRPAEPVRLERAAMTSGPPQRCDPQMRAAVTGVRYPPCPLPVCSRDQVVRGEGV